MTMLTLSEAAELIPGAVVIGDTQTVFERVSTDSRSAAPGDLFVALAGARFDAHDFLGEVAVRGVNAALISRNANDWPGSGIRVADTRVALGALAHGWRRRFTLPVVAVTGSNGKTTVKEMIASIFAAKLGEKACLATAGNFNNEIGLPLTLLRLHAVHRLAVIELGMNHPGETQELARIAAPTVALINNAQREHQEFMVTVEAVALEHAAVIHALEPEGVAVFPADDPYAGIWRVAATDNRIIDFALHRAGCENAAAVVTGRFERGCLFITTPAGQVEVQLRALGEHNARNALAAVAAASAVNISLSTIKRGLEAFEPVGGRLQAKTVAAGALAGTLVIDDSYNANPDSMRAAIDVLASYPAPRVLVIGEMGELGDGGAAFYREIGAYARERDINALYALGSATRIACDAYGTEARHFDDATVLITALLDADFDAQATLLVKGSRFARMERVVEALIKPMPGMPGTH